MSIPQPSAPTPPSPPLNPTSLSRLARTAFSLQQYKLSMLLYARAWKAAPPADKPGILSALLQCAEHTEWGTAYFSPVERGEVDSLVQEEEEVRKREVLRPWSGELKEAVRRAVDEKEAEEEEEEEEGRGRMSRGAFEQLVVRNEASGAEEMLPRNTSWLLPFTLLASSVPRTPSQLHILTSPTHPFHITHLVSLTSYAPFPLSLLRSDFPSLRFTHLPVEDYRPPSLEQLEKFVFIVEKEAAKGGTVLVHCGAGLGRTGTFLAAHVVKHGFTYPRISSPTTRGPRYSAERAIELVREARTGSVEMEEQEEVLREWEEELRGRSVVSGARSG